MSTNAPETRGPEFDALVTRLQHLGRQHDGHVAKTKGKSKVVLAAGVCLIAVSVLGLTSLTSLFFQLDAEALAQIGRQEVEAALPEGGRNLEAHLRERAPGHVNAFLEHLITKSLPRGRSLLKSMVNEELDSLSEEWEKQFSDQLIESIRTSRAQLDVAMPEGSDVEKLDKLVAHVSAQFTEGISVSVQELYPQYAAEMDRLRSYVDGINTSDERTLNERERIHREMIQTFLKLVARENSQRG